MHGGPQKCGSQSTSLDKRIYVPNFLQEMHLAQQHLADEDTDDEEPPWITSQHHLSEVTLVSQ